jgi:hypothetical protein
MDGKRGTVGTQGPQGVQGAQGSNVAQGLQGILGTAGKVIDGDAGSGPDGYRGIQGTAGTKGTTGTANGNGTRGTRGTQGNQGIQGAQGLATAVTQGAQGTMGSVGIQIRGDIAQAESGFTGQNYWLTITGIQGMAGSAQGAQGTQGPAGSGGGGGSFNCPVPAGVWYPWELLGEWNDGTYDMWNNHHYGVGLVAPTFLTSDMKLDTSTIVSSNGWNVSGIMLPKYGATCVGIPICMDEFGRLMAILPRSIADWGGYGWEQSVFKSMVIPTTPQ